MRDATLAKLPMKCVELASVLTLFLAPHLALGQAGGPYEIRRSAIAGGGATFISGGDFELGGTIGQPDAGSLAGGSFALSGGFWSAALAAPSPTPTVTRTQPLNTMTPTSPPTATMTAPGDATPTKTPTSPATGASPTPTMQSTPTPSAPATHSATPSATPTPLAGCVGDCDGSGAVTVDEIVLGVNIALNTQPVSRCTSFDTNGDGMVTVDELIKAVNNALSSCP